MTALLSKEFAVCFEILGVPDAAAAAESFKIIDVNRDGMITKEEYIKAGAEFFLSGEDLPTNIFFGPLVD